MWKYLSDISKGIFLETGASNGILQSNTKMYEDLGWHGLLVEPNRKRCEEAKKYRPNSIVENYAVVSSDHPTDTLLGYFEEDTYTLEAYAIEGNTLYDETGGVGWKQHTTDPVEVPAITLKKLLERHSLDGSSIHFFSLDVEGYELQALDGLDLKVNRPLYIHIEVSDLTQQRYREYLEKQDYVFVESIEGAHDDVYRRKEG
jgi:FkbM family methyltransferase